MNLDFLKEMGSFFPYSLTFVVFLAALIAIWILRLEERDKKILRYKEIADTEYNETEHHGEAVAIRHYLKMSHNMILLKAQMIARRKKELLINKPAVD
jgi:hypothetical protein